MAPGTAVALLAPSAIGAVGAIIAADHYFTRLNRFNFCKETDRPAVATVVHIIIAF